MKEGRKRGMGEGKREEWEEEKGEKKRGKT